jgi:hypothetical protein
MIKTITITKTGRNRPQLKDGNEEGWDASFYEEVRPHLIAMLGRNKQTTITISTRTIPEPKGILYLAQSESGRLHRYRYKGRTYRFCDGVLTKLFNGKAPARIYFK